MKWKPDNHYRGIAVTAFLVVAASMLFYFLLFRTSTLGKGLAMVIEVMNPIIYGYIIAYILNTMLDLIEKGVYKALYRLKCNPGRKVKKTIRMICAFLSLAISIVVVYGIVSSVVPELIRSIRSIILNFQTYVDNVNSFIAETFHNPELDETSGALIDKISESVQNFFSSEMTPRLDALANNVTSGVMNFVTFMKNIFLGVIISMYILIAKEGLLARFRRFIYSVFSIEQGNRILHNLRFADEKFGGFLIGKIIDSVIIGLICYLACLILKMPYTILVSVVIGITNVIPFFGPFIGAIPSALLIFVVDPLKALIFIIFILCLQQFDGNILGPKILGNSVGVSSYMVVLAILIGGGFFGVTGMIIGVPTAAVLIAVIQSGILRRMKAKGLPGDLESYHYVKQINPLTNRIEPFAGPLPNGSLYERIHYRGADVSSFDEPLEGRPWDRTMEQIEEEDYEISGRRPDIREDKTSAEEIFVEEE